MLRTFLVAAAAVASVAVVNPARAEFPERPIKVVVPLAAGGVVDIGARLFAEDLSKRLGVTMTVENRVGGGGAVGAMSVKESRPDGYTLMFTSSSVVIDQAMSNNPTLKAVEDFEIVGIPVEADIGLFANPAAGFKSVKDVVDFARANPGKLKYGSGGIGTAIHFAFEAFKTAAKADIVHVPYTGPNALTAAVAGEVQLVMFDAVFGKPQVDSGKLLMLATGGSQRSRFYPSTPTIAEASGLPGFEANYWMGVFLPKGTPADIVKKYQTAMEQSLADPEVSKKLSDLGFRSLPGSAATAAKRMTDELARWQVVVKEAGIQKR